MTRRIVAVLGLVAVLWGIGFAPGLSPSNGATLEELEQENAKLRQENQSMRQDMSSMLQRMDAVEKALNEKADKATYQEEMKAVLKEMLASQPTTDQWVSTMAANTKLKITGFIRTDISHDTRRTNGGYFATTVLPDGVTGKNDDTNWSVRNSRLAFDLTMPDQAGLKTGGRLELDFGTALEVGVTDLSPKPIRIRHAYMTMKVDREGWLKGTNFLVGQTWDVFSPLFPYTDNVGILWAAGNVGYRRPQIRAERSFEVAPGNKLLAQLALARAVGNDTTLVGTTSDGLDDGAAAGTPDVQARLEYARRLLTAKDTKLGLSGVWGRREVELFPRDDDRYSVNGLALDLTLPLTEKLSLMGEWFIGRGLGSYFGNIVQQYDAIREGSIKGSGGWAQLQYQATPDDVFRGGWGIDSVDDDTLSTVNQAEANTITFVNYSRNITQNIVWTVEYQFMKTDYFLNGAFDNHRVSTSFTLKF